MKFERAFSGAPWEAKVGYCRALRAGDLIFVTGTAPVADDGSVFAPGDGEAQARSVEFGRAHHEYFHEHPPATTMVEVKSLIHPDMLIEIEADAVIG